MKTCCAGMDSLVANAGDRGFAAVAARHRRGVHMQLQWRQFEAGSTVRVVTDPVTAVTLTSSLDIAVCPWCGSKICDMIDADPSGFEDLIARHLRFRGG